jgi:hypothetical protein
MSSTRRSANEINILAMLDRHETGGLPRRLLRGLRGRSAMWYGVAGMLVVGLVGTLGWLAHDSGAPSADDTALAGAVTPVAAQASGGAVRSTPPAAVSLPRLDPAPAAAPEAAPETDAAGGLAPTLASAPAAGATIVEMAPAPLPEPAAPAPRDTQRDTQPATQAPAQHATQHATQRLAAHTPTAKPAARTASPKAPAAANRAAALARAEPRARRTPASAKPAPAAVDTDVALISAIIQHANKRQESEEAARKP